MRKNNFMPTKIDEMDQFWEKYKLSKLAEEKKENMNLNIFLFKNQSVCQISFQRKLQA